MASLTGKTILITGASRGLGVVIARALAAEGAQLVLAARDASKLESTRASCPDPTKVRTVSADLGTPEGRAALVVAAGAIDVLVNNAGVEHPRAVMDQTDAEVDEQIRLNLIAAIDLTRKVLPGMLARKSGVIVNVSSMSGKSPTPYNAIYAATKFGLNGFTASLDIELSGTGVHAGVVCPSFVGGTGMWADTGVAAPKMMPEVTPERVGRAVIDVIRGKREVLVTPSPVRPMLALRELVPGLERRVLTWMGVLDAMKSRAKVLPPKA